ncbi:hypothetical protein DFJ74DRAFT_754223 [Hyaloraphidium curvatum]|nr:hypothetical protein DFJ74DRAFT_754223 [Hyaloraphidium curvatum]
MSLVDDGQRNGGWDIAPPRSDAGSTGSGGTAAASPYGPFGAYQGTPNMQGSTRSNAEREQFLRQQLYRYDDPADARAAFAQPFQQQASATAALQQYGDGTGYLGTNNADILSIVSSAVPYGAPAREQLPAYAQLTTPPYANLPIGGYLGGERAPPPPQSEYEATLAMIEALTLQNRVAALANANAAAAGLPPPPAPRGQGGYPPELERIRQKLSPEEWALLARATAGEASYGSNGAGYGSTAVGYGSAQLPLAYDRRSRSTTISGVAPYLPGPGYPYGTHDRSRSREDLLVPRGPDAKNKKAELYKTELCRSWEETGRCRYGLKCQFAHGEAELRAVERHPKYKTELCKTFWETGWCPYGRRCCFIHTQRDLAKKQDDLEKNLIVLRKPERRRDEEGDNYEESARYGFGTYEGYGDERSRSRTTSYGAGLTNKPPRLQAMEAAEQAAYDIGLDPLGTFGPPGPRAAPFAPLGAIGSEKAAAAARSVSPPHGYEGFGGYGASGSYGTQHEPGRFAADWSLRPESKEFLPTPAVTPVLGGGSKDAYHTLPRPAGTGSSLLGLLSPDASPIRGPQPQATSTGDVSAYTDLLASASPSLLGLRHETTGAGRFDDGGIGLAPAPDYSLPYGAWSGHNAVSSVASTDTLIDPHGHRDRVAGQGGREGAVGKQEEGSEYDRSFATDAEHYPGEHEHEHDAGFGFGWEGEAVSDGGKEREAGSGEGKDGDGKDDGKAPQRFLGSGVDSGWENYTY